MLDAPKIAAWNSRPLRADRSADWPYDYDCRPPPYPDHQSSAGLEHLAFFSRKATGGAERRRKPAITG